MSDSKKKSLIANCVLCLALFSGIFFYVTNSEDPYPYSYQEDDGTEAEVWIGPGFYYGVWFGSEWEYNNWCYANGYSHHGHGHSRHGGGRHH